MTDLSRDNSGNRLIWALISLFGLCALGYAAWLGNAVVAMQSDVAGLKAEVKIILHQKGEETAEVYRGTP
jgi:hypothetical protein